MKTKNFEQKFRFFFFPLEKTLKINSAQFFFEKILPYLKNLIMKLAFVGGRISSKFGLEA